MFIESSFDGAVDLIQLGIAERKEIFCLPTPFVSIFQDAIALDACVRIPDAGELGVTRRFKSRQLGTQLFEPSVLRPV